MVTLRAEGSIAMCCKEYKDRIGRFLDNELASDMQAQVGDHLQACKACQLELENLQRLTSQIFDSSGVCMPSDLWDSIELRLSTQETFPTAHTVHRYRLFRSRQWVLAASLVFVIGLGMLGLSVIDSSAQASTINFGILLDELPVDAHKAFRKFLALYDAQPGSPREARQFAPSLDFETPPALPGGFRLDSVYLLRFGNHPGVAATYDRDGEFLATIFHTPVKKENFGTHKDYPCVIGKHHGHKIEVGSWKIVHLTDSTTCHCILSQLDEALELPAVMAVVAPHTTTTHTHNHHD